LGVAWGRLPGSLDAASSVRAVPRRAGEIGAFFVQRWPQLLVAAQWQPQHSNAGASASARRGNGVRATARDRGGKFIVASCRLKPVCARAARAPNVKVGVSSRGCLAARPIKKTAAR
jgi:hypothetical protein